MKSIMPQIAANDKLKQRLFNNIISDKLSHAYIIEGAKGTGRHLLAKTIAKSLSCLNKSDDASPLPCGICENCRKIEASLCPDVITVGIEERKTSVGIEAARYIKNDIISLPNDIDRKIYIIEDADAMTIQAQNALLLTLESPPQYAFIMLLCEKADNLLETVRSRAPILRTELISRELMAEHLCFFAPEALRLEARRIREKDPADFDEIVCASQGSIGYAYSLLDREKRTSVLKKRMQVRDFVSAVLNSSETSEIIKLISDFPSKRDDLMIQIETVKLALRDLLVLKKSESADLCFYSDREDALDMSALRPAAYLLKFMAACDEAIKALRANSNVKLTTMILATKL